jgi:hypothetical protein
VGWLEDLQELLGESKDQLWQDLYTSDSTPFNELATGDWRGAATAPLSGVLNAWDALTINPVKEFAGGTIGLANLISDTAGGPSNPDVLRAYREDPLGRQVWEDRIQYAPTPVQFAIEAGLSLGTAPGGSFGRMAKGMRRAATMPQFAGQAENLRGSAGLLQTHDFLVDKLPMMAINNPLTRPVGRAAKAGVKKVLPARAFEFTKETQLRRHMDDVRGAFDDYLSAKVPSLFGNRVLPALVRNGTKSLSPFEEYDVPPFFAQDFDEGVPNAVKQKGWEAWQRLRMSQPDLAAPRSMPRPGQATFMEQQRPGGGDGILGRIRGMGQGPLGIVNIPQGEAPAGWVNPPSGGYQSPYELETLTETNLRDIAAIGAAVMLDFDNDNANKLFGALRRAGPGMDKVRSTIAQDYGRGIEPVIPASHEDMVRFFGEDLPDPRFLTQWGWPEGTIPAKRLDAVQKKLDAGKITRQEALELIAGKGFAKGSPELVEMSAAMGGGFLASVRDDSQDAFRNFDPWGGEYAPSGINKDTGRVDVPNVFSSQFEDNRDAYAHYMTQLFPGLQPDELETLRRMSIEAVYDEFMNAAGPVSGGNAGATGLFLKGPGGEYKGDAYTKIGATADPDDPSQIGNRVKDIPQDLPGGSLGKPSLLELNKRAYENATDGRTVSRAEYERVTGKKLGGHPSRTPGNKHVIEMLEAVGATPFTPNKKGGPLPSMQRIVDIYNAGKEIPVGSIKAKEWYEAAAKEAIRIAGPGRYEDAMVLMDLMAITSAGTGVEDNARMALRAFAEWKFGSDDLIRNKLGLSPEQVDALIKPNGKWSEGNTILRDAMKKSQKKKVGEAFEEYINRRASTDQSWKALQGGPKTNNFAGSFVFKLWQDAIDYSLADNPSLHSKIKGALDEAATLWTEDRHQSRVSNLATGVSEMGAGVNRERGIIAAKSVGVRPEDMQAATWYWSKDAQGFTRIGRNDDMASALREAWEKAKPPGSDARIREFIQKNHDNVTDQAELDRIGEDLMRQEVMMSLVEEALRKNKSQVKKAFGPGKELSAFLEATDDTIGIINRAGRGVLPERQAGPQIPVLANDVLRTLEGIRNGNSYGATFAWNGMEWVSENATSGYAVALSSAGRSVNTRTPKTALREITKFIQKHGDLIDDPGEIDRIKFGLFEMPGGGEASFDLTIIVPDEATAVALGRKANQVAIYDIANGRNINVGGDGTPVLRTTRDIKRALDETLGPPSRQKVDIRDAFKRGATIEEMDRVNPISILNRKVITPFMQNYEEQSLKAIAAPSDRGMHTQRRLTASGMRDEDVFNAPVAGYDDDALRIVPTQVATLLTQQGPDGREYRHVLNEYFAEGEADLDVLREAGLSWGPNTTLDDRIKMAGGNADAVKVIKKYDAVGVDPVYATPRDLALARLAKEESKAFGINLDRQTTYDLLRAAWGEQALASIKYHTGNIQGAWIQNAFGGVLTMPGPAQFLAAFKLARGGEDEVSKQAQLESLHAYQVAKKWGEDKLPSEVFRGGPRDMVSNRTRISSSAMGELAGRATRSAKIGEWVGKPFVWNNNLGQAIDTVFRGTLWSTVLDREMSNAMVVIEDSIMQMARKQGLEGFEFSIINNVNPVPGGPSSARLRDHLKDLGFADGYAERAARNYSEAKNIAKAESRKEVTKRQFSYDKTNLDAWVGSFAPFMYWFSRAIPYYGEEVVRHPQLMINYMRANDGIEDAQDDPGLSASQKGFIRLMGTPLGFSLLMNPDSLFGVVKIFGLQDTYQPDGETEMGGVISWLKARGMGMYPWIDGTLNLMGVYGDTFEPDLLGIRHKTLIGSAVNFMRSVLGMDPAAAPYQTAMGQARWQVSQFASQFTPDWLAQPVVPKAGGNTTEATMDAIIESRVVANNPSLSNEQLLAIMSDTESPEYIEAFQQTAAAGFAQQLLNFTLPQSYRLREDTRDVRNRQTQLIGEAAEKQGVHPSEFKPTVGDVEFARRYEDQTGKVWKPRDYEKASDTNNILRATPESKALVAQQIEYGNLGGPELQRIYQRYQDIRNGDVPETATLDPDSRQVLADLWADRSGNAEKISYLRQLQGNYKDTHQEFGQFKTWQGAMYDLKNHLGGSLMEYRRQAVEQNPNAAKYFADQATYIQETFDPSEWEQKLEDATVSADAYMAINGIPRDRYSPSPIPGTVPMDITLPQMAPAQDTYVPQPDFLSQINYDLGSGPYNPNNWWNQ